MSVLGREQTLTQWLTWGVFKPFNCSLLLASNRLSALSCQIAQPGHAFSERFPYRLSDLKPEHCAVLAQETIQYHDAEPQSLRRCHPCLRQACTHTLSQRARLLHHPCRIPRLRNFAGGFRAILDQSPYESVRGIANSRPRTLIARKRAYYKCQSRFRAERHHLSTLAIPTLRSHRMQRACAHTNYTDSLETR